jgi:hypothetical protein
MSNRRLSAYCIPPAGNVSALRQRMIDDMTVRNLAPNTMLCYSFQRIRHYGLLGNRHRAERLARCRE